MERLISKLLTPHILQDALGLFGASSEPCHLISDMENFVFECMRGDKPIILRITPDSHRNFNEIMGELDWIRYLSKNGIAVPQPIRSKQVKLIEEIALQASSFFITAFQKIEGKNIIEAEACTPEVYQEWGRIMGKIHHLSKSYIPQKGEWQRSQWFENDIWVNINYYLNGQPKILEKIQAQRKYFSDLPQDVDSYGLIHADFTDVNFFIKDGRISVFDFDDSEHHWFIYDIAIALFDTLPWLPKQGMDEAHFRAFFWDYFYQGYTSENQLSEFWIKQLPAFMKLRETFLYGVFHKKWDLGHLTDWQQKMLAKYKYNIENDNNESVCKPV